ncbi:hypothetical protein BCR43DRAFT_511670 [Syncephalastrum racemosum]|uniref:Uncharacterized protein n=1 Tax=Syncephalastrum racemosum TaxID=13706 RepID=A0A1X2HMU3_SYNRA|nr:hypothetical protein BCR43DRAFT_511670 [Syncephalastrum racemosum]
MQLLALGHLTMAVRVESIVEEAEHDPPASLIAIQCFVRDPPQHYPTLAKYRLKAIDDQDPLLHTLWGALHDRFGVVALKEQQSVSLLSPLPEPGQFLLHVVRLLDLSDPKQQQIATLDMRVLQPLPLEALQLCQQKQDPAAMARLAEIAKQLHQTAQVYAYWDLWRVLEGICTRFDINPNDFL